MDEMPFTGTERAALWFVVLVFLPIGLVLELCNRVSQLVKAGDMPHVEHDLSDVAGPKSYMKPKDERKGFGFGGM